MAATVRRLRARLGEVRALIRARGDRTRAKGQAELDYWRGVTRAEKQLGNEHFEWVYTEIFGVAPAFYEGKRILDVGCGPRGSLEWASRAAQCVGVDTLVDSYRREMGIATHAMLYVAGAAESLPFASGQFDVVSSFNSLDHVDALERAIQEIIRVVAPGGLLLLIAEVNHRPTITEPVQMSWSVVDLFAPAADVLDARRYEMVDGVYQSVRAARPYDDTDVHPGLLVAKLRKKATE